MVKIRALPTAGEGPQQPECCGNEGPKQKGVRLLRALLPRPHHSVRGLAQMCPPRLAKEALKDKFVSIS